MAEAALIAVDWGTSSLRAYLVARDGTVLEERASADGILAVPRQYFEEVLARHVDGWHAGSTRPLPITMSGMIGSRQGWAEAAYCECPANASAIAGTICRIETAGLGPLIVFPGLITRDTRGTPDVMRGEETQVLGALTQNGSTASTELFVLPGTHSKWVTVEAATITDFRTFMTGEIYAALLDHTILGRLAEGRRAAPHAFASGVRSGAEAGAPGSLLARVFSARTRVLAGGMPGDDVADYLSGLLIGAELACAAPGSSRFTIIATEALQQRYRDAATVLGLSSRAAAPTCVAAGHLVLARAAGLLE